MDFTREEVIAGVAEMYADTAVGVAPGTTIMTAMDEDILAVLTGRDIAELSLKYNLAFKARPVQEVRGGSPGA